MQVFSKKIPDSTNLPSEHFLCLKLFNFSISLCHFKDFDVMWNWYTLLHTQNCASTTASPCVLLTFLYQMSHI